MTDMLIPDVPPEVAAALTERARAAGMDCQEWLRLHLMELVEQPLVMASYTFRFRGPQEEVYGYIQKYPDGNFGAELRQDTPLTPEQESAFERAIGYVERNEPGDRENALKLLNDAFKEVHEKPSTGY